MRQQVANHHELMDGNPAGGWTSGTGFFIRWQNGPLGRGEDRQEPNGAFVEGVIQAAIDRLDFYNEAGFACVENVRAIAHLNMALEWLDERTDRREAQGFEGTHEGT